MGVHVKPSHSVTGEYCIEIAAEIFRMSVAVLMLLVCCSVVQKRPDQCNEATRLRATVTR
jgi:hypothetical protein